MSYLPYSIYQESGIEWIGEVPTGWAVWKAAHGFNRIGSGTTPKSDNPEFYDGHVPWVTTSELRETTITDTTQKLTEDALNQHSALKTYKTGSLVMAMYGATIGRLGILGIDATVNQACCVFSEPIVFNIKFFYYWLWMRRPVLISQSTGGGQPNLSQDDLKQLKIPLPPSAEQTAIANFLDHETAKIDTLIAKQQRLIELLQEKRQALISHAVTKGLNPDAPMKDSGVEWLGEIPERWLMARLGYELQRIETGWTPDSEQRLAEDDEWAVLKVGCIRNGYFYEDEHKALLPNVIPLPELEVHPGDLLMSRANTTELVGSIGLIRQTRPKLTLSDKTFRLILKDSVLPEYANFLFQSKIARIQIELAASGASPSMKNISQESIRAIKLPIPPVTQQQQIVNFLNCEFTKIDQLIQKTQHAIELSTERRSSLISAAVTGKIDVRNIRMNN